MVRWLLLAAVLGGCGLVDPDITNFELYVRDKEFTVDTDQWDLMGVDQLTSTSCDGTTNVCAAAAMQACTAGECFGICGAAGTCELQLLVTRWAMVDPDTENPELRDITSEPVVEVTIDAIAYQVIENTLNIETPEFVVYAAPATIMSPGDPEARPIGTIPPVPANTLVAEQDIELTPEGRDALADFMGDYMTPFNILVGTELIVGDGDPVPEGTITAVVRVRAHAGL